MFTSMFTLMLRFTIVIMITMMLMFTINVEIEFMCRTQTSTLQNENDTNNPNILLTQADYEFICLWCVTRRRNYCFFYSILIKWKVREYKVALELSTGVRYKFCLPKLEKGCVARCATSERKD